MYTKHTYHRVSRRLPNYDYSKEGLCFITLNAQNGAPLFGDIYNGELLLNTFGKVAKEEWLKTEQIRDNIALHEFIVMPTIFMQ